MCAEDSAVGHVAVGYAVDDSVVGSFVAEGAAAEGFGVAVFVVESSAAEGFAVEEFDAENSAAENFAVEGSAAGDFAACDSAPENLQSTAVFVAGFEVVAHPVVAFVIVDIVVVAWRREPVDVRPKYYREQSHRRLYCFHSIGSDVAQALALAAIALFADRKVV